MDYKAIGLLRRLLKLFGAVCGRLLEDYGLGSKATSHYRWEMVGKFIFGMNIGLGMKAFNHSS